AARAPLFLSKRRKALLRRQAGFLAPGSAAPSRCAPSRLPRVIARVASWDWLPGYSGGTAPAFNRRPPGPPDCGGATAADFDVLRRLLPRSGEVKGGADARSYPPVR